MIKTQRKYGVNACHANERKSHSTICMHVNTACLLNVVFNHFDQCRRDMHVLSYIYIGGTIFELFLAILVLLIINYNHDPKIRNWDSTTEIKHNKKMAQHVDCEPNLVLTLTTRSLTC